MTDRCPSHQSEYKNLSHKLWKHGLTKRRLSIDRMADVSYFMAQDPERRMRWSQTEAAWDWFDEEQA